MTKNTSYNIVLNMEENPSTTVSSAITRSMKLLLLLLLATVFIVGCGSDDDTTPPPQGGNNTLPPADPQLVAFETNLHPVLVSRCGGCHAGQAVPTGTPDFAHADVATAFAVVNSNTLVNLGNPDGSRLVEKPLLLHKCTEPDCTNWSNEIKTGVENWATEVAGTGGGGAGINGDSIVSAALTLAEGTKNNGAGRVEDAIIAKYLFKTGTGTTAFDTSGMEPALNLTLSADVNWIPGQGIEVTDPNAAEASKAVGTPETSKKLYDKIAGPAGSKAYTIEAWIINANTALDGPARIVSYSQNSQNRNFTMGQVTNYYNFRNRSDLTGTNGSAPALESNNGDADLKAELQHVVFTFDTTNGRNIYVNGKKTLYHMDITADPAVPVDPATPILIDNWDANYTFVLGNEAADNVQRQWLGKLLFVGIHNRALTAAEIQQNTLEGIGDKYILDFDVSSLLDTSGATTSKIRFVVSELDQYSYVFGNPSLITDIAVPDIPVKNISIAVNNNIPAAAQSFRNVDVAVKASNTELSPLGAVIPKDKGPDSDQFSLVFEVLGNNSNIVVETNPDPVPDLTVNDPSPEHGLRTYEQINNSMSVLTGVEKSLTQATFDELQQQLPSTPNLGSFVSAHQIGISKLALEYCDALVESNSLRTGFFGNGFQFTSAVSEAFSDTAQQDIIISNLVYKMVGSNLSSQPSLQELQPDLYQLIGELSAGCSVPADCDQSRTRTIVKATCAAVLGSAVVLID